MWGSTEQIPQSFSTSSGTPLSSWDNKMNLTSYGYWASSIKICLPFPKTASGEENMWWHEFPEKSTPSWKLCYLMCLLERWLSLSWPRLIVRKNLCHKPHDTFIYIYTHMHTHKNFPYNSNWSHLWLWLARNEHGWKELTWKCNRICSVPDLDSENLGSKGTSKMGMSQNSGYPHSLGCTLILSTLSYLILENCWLRSHNWFHSPTCLHTIKHC